MQKKSLLVALFCGALCLTGCIKNEESASVAQVRIAKANELNSIADLNKAKAAAEAVYAQAELVVAQAEAKLREANAALVLAQAETEKVRAELLKVRVALAEVEVDEEKVRLQMLEADLEQKLAEVEAAVAKAEAEKQKYINELEDLLAKAEIQAVTNAQALLTAQDNLAKYLLKLEGEKLDSAKRYATLYTQAVDKVQSLQSEVIMTKATKALIEAGAMGVREAIYDKINEIDKKIAEKEEIVAYLKEHQNMTPEEAEAALKEARIELDAAYNAYAAALATEDDAKGAYLALEAKTSLFELGWESKFTNFITNNWGRQWGRRGYRSYVRQKDFADYEDFADVTYFGYNDPSDRSKFVKLWKVEQSGEGFTNPVLMYPEKTVDWIFPMYDEMVIAPAEIYYDNIEAVLDSIADRDAARVAKEVENAKKFSAWNVKNWTAKVETYTDSLALIQQYVDARKDTIAKYEKDLESLVNAYNTSAAGHATAQQAYYEYMLINYDIPRGAFEAEIEAANDTAKVSTPYWAAKAAKEDAEAAEVEAKADTTTAGKNLATAKAEYEAAVAEAEADWATYNNSYVDALHAWSPVFTYKKVAKGKGISSPNKYYWYELGEEKITVPHITPVSEKFDSAGRTQRAWMDSLDSREGKFVIWEAAKTMYEAQPTTAHEQELATARANYKTDSAMVKHQEDRVLLAEVLFEALQDKYDEIWGDIAEGIYNPEFANVEFGDNNLKYDKTNDEWYMGTGSAKKVAGTAQADKFMADSLLKVAKDSVTSKTNKFNVAKQAYDPKIEAWETASNNLKRAFAEGNKDYKADPKVAELYAAAKQAPVAKTKVNKQLDSLHKRYGILHKNNFTYQAPNDPYRYPNYNGGMNWLRSNFNLNPDYEYVYDVKEEADGKLVIVKKAVSERSGVYARSNSLSVKKAEFEDRIANEPENLENRIARIENSREVKQLKEDIADVKAALKQYKAYESEYKTWVADREKAFKAWQDTRKASYEAMVDEFEAKNAYDATEALANGGMWVYDPDWTIWNAVYTTEAERTAAIRAGYRSFMQGGFSFIPVNKAIEQLEGEKVNLFTLVKGLKFATDVEVADADDAVAVTPAATPNHRLDVTGISNALSAIDDIDEALNAESIAELNFVKKLLQETLKYGKLAFETVIEAFDEEIAQLEDQISTWSVIADKYKALMNAWLGIVDEAVVEEPVEEEGDEE